MNVSGAELQREPEPKGTAKFLYASGARPLSGYTIKRGVGRGGFGEVYYALSDAGKEVALKLIRRNLDVELRGVGHCLNLKHPNLVSIFDVRRDDEDNSWLIMEYVAGDSLDRVIAAYPQGIAPAEAMRWFRGVAAGVAYLHDHGIVHRDLKPGNIFREEDTIKLGDYGLSKFISCSRRSGQTESIGTVYYMAPEIARGRYGKEIDIYALGAILYEMLTGRAVFDGESVGEVLMKHLTGDPDLSPLAEPFRSVVGRALAKDPAARFATVGEMVAALDGAAPPAWPQAAPAEPVLPVLKLAEEQRPKPQPNPEPKFAEPKRPKAMADSPTRTAAGAEKMPPIPPASEPEEEDTPWNLIQREWNRLGTPAQIFIVALLGVATLAGGGIVFLLLFVLLAGYFAYRGGMAFWGQLHPGLAAGLVKQNANGFWNQLLDLFSPVRDESRILKIVAPAAGLVYLMNLPYAQHRHDEWIAWMALCWGYLAAVGLHWLGVLWRPQQQRVAQSPWQHLLDLISPLRDANFVLKVIFPVGCLFFLNDMPNQQRQQEWWMGWATFFSAYLAAVGLHWIAGLSRPRPQLAPAVPPAPRPAAQARPVAEAVAAPNLNFLNRRKQWRDESTFRVVQAKSLVEKLMELVGSMLLSALVALAVGLVLVLSQGQMRMEQYAWLAITSTIGAWGILIPAKFWEGRPADAALRRFVLLLTGFGVGAAAFGVQTALLVNLRFHSAQVLPKIQNNILRNADFFAQDGTPLIATQIAFFGCLFALVRWWKQANPGRGSRLSIGALVISALGAYIVSLFWAYPQPWGILVGVTTSLAVQLASPWRGPVKERTHDI